MSINFLSDFSFDNITFLQTNYLLIGSIYFWKMRFSQLFLSNYNQINCSMHSSKIKLSSLCVSISDPLLKNCQTRGFWEMGLSLRNWSINRFNSLDVRVHNNVALQLFFRGMFDCSSAFWQILVVVFIIIFLQTRDQANEGRINK